MRWFLLPTLTASFLISQEAPKPTPHHEAMKAAVGTWDAVVKMQVGPGKPPMESKGVEVNRLLMGGLWMQSSFSSDMGGVPFEGSGLFGYDPAKGRHVGTWVDSMVMSQAFPQGTCKDHCREVTMTFMGVGMDGKPCAYKEVSTQVDADHRTMTMYVKGKDGKYALEMEIAYTRRK
jgi:hypothetical protein